jgi:shikimate kinase
MSEESSRPILLVGFMGAGKTTVGKALAERLGYQFLDLDEVIEAAAGMSVRTIFAEFGESEFRRRETEAIAGCRGLSRTVVALGGGAYVSEENRRMASEIGTTVWLDCPLTVCLSRIGADPSRPRLGNEVEMEALLDLRRASYAMADCAVNTGDRTPDDAASEIARVLGRTESS